MPRAKRKWRLVAEKMEDEHGCRVCGNWRVEWAHVSGRAHDDRHHGVVDPLDVVPLCPTHHLQYDAHALDLKGALTDAEIKRAIEVLGYHSAARRIRSSRNPGPLCDRVVRLGS